MTHMVFELRSGRRLGITGIGEPLSTRVVILCHSAPGVGGIDPDPRATSESGLRIIGIDRPGYGASDGYAGEPDVSAWTRDVREYLRELEPTARQSSGVDIELAGVIGIGYGAFFAAALAEASPGVRRLVVIEPAAPVNRSAELDDPALRDPDQAEPMSGLADRAQPSIDAADSSGAVADHLLLADVGWGHRIRAAQVSTDLIAVGDDHGAEWWRRHLYHPSVHRLEGEGLVGLVAGWRVALELLAAPEAPAA